MLFILFISALVTAFYDKYQYEPLANVRSKLVFRQQTPQQKLDLVEGAMNLMSIYVNKKVKLNDFGVDPMPALLEMKRTAVNMTEEEIHRKLLKIFRSLRDLHTSYVLEGPYSCFKAITGLKFTFAEPNSTVVFTKTNGYENVTKLNPHIFEQIQPGDVLLRVNNQTIDEYISHDTFGGANPSAVKRRALETLSEVYGGVAFLPDQDFLSLDLVRGNRIFNIQVPWIANYAPQCYIDELKPKEPAPIRIQGSQRPKIKPQTWMGLPEKMLEMNALPSFNSTSATFSWKVHGKLGIIRLTAFLTEYEKVSQVITEHLNETDALLFDLRDNGGGNADTIRHYVNLFSDKYSSFTVRATKSKLNDQIFQTFTDVNDEYFSPDVKAYFSNSTDDFYANGRLWDDLSQPSGTKRVYFKPVGILTNAACYSACDIFSAVAQDDGGAIIFGEDETTGAGGANVVSSGFFEGMADSTYKLSAISASVSWRQCIRSNSHLIEDEGVKTQVFVRPTIDDIKQNLPGPYDQILKHLISK